MLEKLLLPICLALMMLSLGLRLQLADFIRVIQHPQRLLLGLLLQFLALPILALILIKLLQLPSDIAAGLLLVSLVPGGATSNAITALCRGDVALSVGLTGLSSLLVPFTLPLLWQTITPWLGHTGSQLSLPFQAVFMPLVMVSILPILLGMLVRRYCSAWIETNQHWLQPITGMVFATLVVVLVMMHWSVLMQFWPQAGVAVLLLCITAMLLSAMAGKLARQSPAVCITYSVEIGVQNAGTAMLVAATLLQQPPLTLLALCYGVLMNIPVLALWCWSRTKPVEVNHTS